MNILIGILANWILDKLYSEVKSFWDDDSARNVIKNTVCDVDVAFISRSDRLRVAKDRLKESLKINDNVAELLVEKAVQRYLKDRS